MANEFIIKNGLIAAGIKFPTTDGSNGQVLTTDGSGNLIFATPSSSGLQNVVEDTTPQLGGNLDLNGNDITGSGNIQLTSTDNRIRAVYTSASALPAAASYSGMFAYAQVEDSAYYSNGTSWIALGESAASGLQNIVEDLTPQLGGDLDMNGAKIHDPTNGFVIVEHNLVGSLLVRNTTGADANVQSSPAAGGSNLDGQNLQLTAGDGDGSGDGGNLRLYAGTSTGAGADGYIFINDIRWPLNDGTTGQVLVTNGAGVLSWQSQSGGLANVVEDTTPQLGGDLDVQSNRITTSVVNGNIEIIPNGTGEVIIGSTGSGVIAASDAAGGSNGNGEILALEGGAGDGTGNGGNITLTPGAGGGSGSKGSIIIDYATFPAADGSSGQVLTTDGTGGLSWTTVSGAGGDVAVQDEGTQIMAAATALNFVGAGVTATDGGGGVATITIPGGGAAALNDLSDVNIGTPTVTEDGYSLTWNNTAGEFQLTNVSGGGSSNTFTSFIVEGKAGTISPETTTDTFTFVEGTGITMTTDPLNDKITIAASGEANQNTFSNIAVSGQTTVSAETTTDTLTLAAGAGINITTNATTDTVTIASTASAPNLFETISADTGSTTADTATDTLTVSGGNDISTTITGDTLTINYTGPAEVNQNAFSSVAVSGQTTLSADSQTDTLTLIAGTNVTLTTNATNDSVTIDAASGGGGATVLNDLTDVDTTGVTSGQVLKYNGTSWAPAADNEGAGGGGTITSERIRINFTGTDIWSSYSENTSGVSGTIKSNTSATDVVSTFTFTGYTMPPASIMFYGFDAANQRYSVRNIPLTAINVAPSTSGDVNNPNTFTAFSTIELTTTVNDMGGSKKTGLPTIPAHGYVVFLMQG